MATTRIWAVRSRLDHMVDYVSNKEKTVALETVIDYATNDKKIFEKEYVTCINCAYHDPYSSMTNTKKQFNDNKEILAFHGYQSFEAGEVTPELAHQIGVEFANKLWGDRFEVVVATHLNTEHIHNNFLINATSCVDGKRYCNTNKDIHNMREVSDGLCRKYHLSVINKTKEKDNYYREKPLRELAKESIDYAISISLTFTSFVKELDAMGFEVRGVEDSFKIRHISSSKFIRVKSLGNSYTFESIRERILGHPIKIQTIYDKKNFDIDYWCKKYERGELTGFQKLIMHYQYVLGILPKPNSRRFKYSKEYYRALKHMDEISDQTILMFKYDIKTIDDLENFQSNIETKLNKKLEQRQKLYNKIRRCKDTDLKSKLQTEAKSYSKEIKELRKQMKLCNGIEERSKQMEQTISTIQEKERGKNRYERY